LKLLPLVSPPIALPRIARRATGFSPQRASRSRSNPLRQERLNFRTIRVTIDVDIAASDGHRIERIAGENS
jgi:hypothetical protein